MPRIVDHDAYREELLTNAVPLFAAHGYAALSLRKLAIGLGVSTGTLYHYFDSKDAIYTAMVELMSEGLIEDALTLVEEEFAREQRIRLVIGFVASRSDKLKLFLQVAIDAQLHKADNPTIGAAISAAVGRMIDAIRDNIVDVTAAEARMIFNTLAGGIVQEMIGDSPSTDWSIASDFVVNALRR